MLEASETEASPSLPVSYPSKNSSALRLSSASHRMFVFTKRAVTFVVVVLVVVDDDDDDVDVRECGSFSAPGRTRPWPDARGSEGWGR